MKNRDKLEFIFFLQDTKKKKKKKKANLAKFGAPTQSERNESIFVLITVLSYKAWKWKLRRE